jgi:hypothetical protein
MPTPRISVAGGHAHVLHSIKTGDRLEQYVEGHAARTNSTTFQQARAILQEILPMLFGGVNPWDTGKRSAHTAVQAHHGGSILVKDGTIWRLVLNWAGIEWAEQFAADPTRVDDLRQNAEAIVRAFPLTEPGLIALGLPKDHVAILHATITTQDDIGRYVDSVFNACVPIPQPQHTGTVKASTPLGAGVHNYPLPACNIPMFCRADFTPFVVDHTTGTTAIVVPVAPRHSGDGRVRVITADPASPLATEHHGAHDRGAALVLDADHPLAIEAFARQTAP